MKKSIALKHLLIISGMLFWRCDPGLWQTVANAYQDSQKNQANKPSQNVKSYSANVNYTYNHQGGREIFDRTVNGVSAYYKWNLINSASNGSRMCYAWELTTLIKNKSGANKNVSPVSVVPPQISDRIVFLPSGWRDYGMASTMSTSNGGWLTTGDKISVSPLTVYTGSSFPPGKPTIMFEARDY